MRTPVLIFSLAAAFAASMVPAFAQEPAPAVSASPTPEELIAREKEAEQPDKRPETERESWAIHVAGLDGTLELLRRGDDMETEQSLGPFKTAKGTFHAQHWHQNENGETVLDRPEPSQVERPVEQTVLRVHDPVDAWELATTFSSGHVTRFYYDPRSFHVIRTEKTVAGHTSHITYEDYRPDARGRSRFWHYYGGDDRPDNDFDYRLLRDDENAEIADAEIAIPHDRRTLVEFPDGVDTVRLPARIENDRIYVRLDIQGRGLDFLLDTGASTLSINENIARELKLPLYGRTTQTVAGSFQTGRVVAPSIAIGSLTMHEVVMRTVPLASNESHDTRVVGLLGFDFIDEAGLRIDYAGGTVDAIRPGSLVVPAGSMPLDVRLNSGTPVTRATIGDDGGDDFLLDTGAAFSYVVFQRFARAHPEDFSASEDAKVSYGSGVGGTMAYRKLDTKRIGLGSWTFNDEFGVEALSPDALGFDTEDGLIGADILKLFTVYLDYASDHVYLVPNGREPMLEASGVTPAANAMRTSAHGQPDPGHSPPRSDPQGESRRR